MILECTFIRCKPYIEWFDHTYKIIMSTSRIKITEQVQLHLALLVEFYHVLLIIALYCLYCTVLRLKQSYSTLSVMFVCTRLLLVEIGLLLVVTQLVGYGCAN